MDTTRLEVTRYAQLKEQYESCHARVQRARARAVLAAQETEALRTILRSRAGAGSAASGDRAVWIAATRAVAEMARERDRILGTVSHEMRQALAAALAAQHVLVERSSDPAAPRAATVLERQLQHLAKLVELLLDYSHLTVGTSALATEPLDVRGVVRETVEACQADATAAGIEFRESLWHSPQCIEGDPTRLRQLVSNLVHNALRYTAAGGRVECATLTRDNAVEIIVSDTGIGIAAEDLEHIFEPFRRAVPGSDGLGVGLAIARRIARLHGGDITANSDGPGRGARFTAVLPLGRALT